jgi:hypothetical protein
MGNKFSLKIFDTFKIVKINKSPAYSFIQERIELEFERLEREKITPWSCFRTDKGVQLTDFYGKVVSYSGGGLLFESSPRAYFWNGFIQPFLNDIVSRNFAETEDFCRKKGLDWQLPLEETAFFLKAGINKIYKRMSIIDQRLRGEGFPDSVPLFNPKQEIVNSILFVDQRLTAMRILRPKFSKKFNSFYEENKFLFWLIGFIIAVLGL